MGKASRKLKQALKEHEDSTDKSTINTNLYNQQNNQEVYDNKIHNIALLIYANLIKYTQDEGYPLCEFLDLTNIENYIRWIMAYYR